VCMYVYIMCIKFASIYVGRSNWRDSAGVQVLNTDLPSTEVARLEGPHVVAKLNS
jgi:hypothetical protein